MIRALTASFAAVALLAAAATRPAAQQPPAVTLLRAPDAGLQPQMAIDAKGNIHVVYFKGDPAHGDVYYTRLGPDDRFVPSIRVNTQSGSAMATGTMRGPRLAVGQNGRVHVAWYGSDRAVRGPGGSTPVLYTRLADNAQMFEPERNLVQQAFGLDGGTVAADAAGHVYVLWHAAVADTGKEDDRQVWVTRSNDDGRTFSAPAPLSDPSTGACGCCGIGALADRRGTLYVLYRSASDLVHRDTYLITSKQPPVRTASERLETWNVRVCPMSTFALTETTSGVLAAWETDGQIRWSRAGSDQGSAAVPAPGPAQGRKHPAIAANARGETLLVWTEGTGWNRGGSLAWQLFDADRQVTSVQGRTAGVPTWSLAAVAVRPDGRFVILY